MRIKNNPLTLLSTKKALQLLTTTLFKVFIYRVFYLPIQYLTSIDLQGLASYMLYNSGT